MESNQSSSDSSQPSSTESVNPEDQPTETQETDVRLRDVTTHAWSIAGEISLIKDKEAGHEQHITELEHARWRTAKPASDQWINKSSISEHREHSIPKAVWNNIVLAESDQTQVVEGNHYFPSEILDREYFRECDARTVCGWKGTASYYHVVVDGEVNEQAAWNYPEPKTTAGISKAMSPFGRMSSSEHKREREFRDLLDSSRAVPSRQQRSS